MTNWLEGKINLEQSKAIKELIMSIGEAKFEVIVLLRQYKDRVEVLLDGNSCGSIIDVRPYNNFPTTAYEVMMDLFEKMDVNVKVKLEQVRD